jgi:hypothetical protein
VRNTETMDLVGIEKSIAELGKKVCTWRISNDRENAYFPIGSW